METKEAAERVVIAKPVASKPNCSTFRSFSELLAGAINDSSPPRVALSDTAVAAIRPKTFRVTSKPAVTTIQASAGVVCSQSHSQVGVSRGAAVLSGVLGQSLDTLLASDTKSTVVYKPLAKLVSKSTVSLLANMGNFDTNPPQGAAGEPVEPQTQQLSRSQGMDLRPIQNEAAMLSLLTEQSRFGVMSRGQPSSQNTEEDSKSTPTVANVDRPAYDGYNWRKYGQKQVKGSEYPRSYYKCTHPNCPVKKKVERSFDGQITEVVYKGEHNHIKPQPPKKTAPAGESGAQDFSSHFVNDARQQYVSDQEKNEMMRPSAMLAYQGSNPTSSTVVPDNSCGFSTDHDDGSKGIDADDEEPRSKRRKSDVRTGDQAGPSGGEGMQVPNIVVQSSTDIEIVGDGYRWRKYGQKVVKGNPYPRSYYRCTSPKCNVRKHVERASEDPKSLITTYEGKHNHDIPSRSSAQAVSEQGSQQTQASKDKK